MDFGVFRSPIVVSGFFREPPPALPVLSLLEKLDVLNLLSFAFFCLASLLVSVSESLLPKPSLLLLE